MNETDYKTLILTYQQKSFDLFSQTVALEARLKTSTQLIEELSTKVNQLTSEIDSLNSKISKKTQKVENLNSEGF